MRNRAIAASRRGARRAQALYVHGFKLQKVIGEVTDPITGKVTDLLADVDSGYFKLQSFKAQATEPDAAGHSYLVGKSQAHFPLGSSGAKGYRSGMILSVTESLLPDDTALIGQVFRLVEPDLKSIRTADRWSVEVILS